MKCRRFIYIVGFSYIFLIPVAFSQPWLYNYTTKFKSTSDKLSFEEKQEAFNEYWQNKKIDKGKGYKPFRRWEYMMAPRLNGNESLNGIGLWADVNRIILPPEDSIFWSFVGPEKTPYVIETKSPTGNGRLNCIAFHPNDSTILYVGAPSGGFWKSTDAGRTWRTTTDKLNAIGISDIVVAYNNPSVIYVATGDGDAGDTYAIGIIKSTDGGENWVPTGLSLEVAENIYFRRIIMHPGNADFMLATSSKGIYKTVDGWQTYSLVQSGDFKDIEFRPGDPTYIYATSYSSSGNAKIYRSTNGGNSFAIISGGLALNNKIERIELAVTNADPKIIYALASSSANSGLYAIYRSRNSGDSWVIMYDESQANLLGWSSDGSDAGGQGWYDLSLAVSPINANVVLVGGVNIWKSANGGTSWNISGIWYYSQKADYVHADQHMFAFSPHSNTLYAVNDGGVYLSYDFGKNWKDISNNLQILQAYRLGTSLTNNDKIICGNQDNGTFFLTNNEWFQVLGGDGMECIIDPYNENIIYGSTQNGSLFRSTDGGINFQSIKPDADLSGAWVTPFVIDPQNPSILYAAYNDVYRSNDGGNTWTKISTNLAQTKLSSLIVAPSNNDYIYTANYYNIYSTQNGGVKWIDITSGLPDHAITSVMASPNDPNKVWVSLSGYTDNEKVYYSNNGGISWTNISAGLPNLPINHLTIRYNSNQEIYAATDNGVYYRNASMDEWVDYSSGLPKVIVNELEITQPGDYIRAATYGRGIWEAKLPPPVESKAAFTANITKGCADAPFIITFTGSEDFDSLNWIHNATEILYQSEKKDTIILSFASTGKKTIQLKHYYNDTITSEIKYQYLEVNNTLEFSLSPDKYYACDTSSIKVFLPKGYNYNWQPSEGIDSINDDFVIIKPERDIVYTVTAIHGSCESSNEISLKLMPDDICEALTLTRGLHGPFSNICGTKEETEPLPPAGTGANNGCLSQDGWCEGEARLDNPLWFKIVVPDSGKLWIRCYGFDSQIALYKAESCTGLLSGEYTLLAANDDISSSVYNSEIGLLSDLIPGDTLYLQVDGSYGGITGEFFLNIADNVSAIHEPDPLAFSNIKIYPNPAKGSFTVKLIIPGRSVVDVDIITESGQVIKSVSSNVPVGFFEETFDLSGYKGLILIRIQTNASISYRKLIVE